MITRWRGGLGLVRLVAVLCALAGAGCDDPVHDAEIAALGPEAAGVPPGPLHRPGQPCLVCHDGEGPAELVFGTAGTVFQDATDPFPLVSGLVKLTDQNMNVTTLETNCAGNFFVEAVDWTPTMPVHVEVLYGSSNIDMLSHMGKETSCAQCHTGVTTPSSVLQVYLNDTPPPCMTVADCPTGWTCDTKNQSCFPPPSGCP
jgi:hypothetical protein